MSHMATFTSIDDYVASFPDGPREILVHASDVDAARELLAAE